MVVVIVVVWWSMLMVSRPQANKKLSRRYWHVSYDNFGALKSVEKNYDSQTPRVVIYGTVVAAKKR